MVSEILQKIKEKKRGIVVVHNGLTAYSDFLDDKENVIYDYHPKTDFDNYLFSFGFLKNVKVSVHILSDHLTAVILIGEQMHTYEEFERLSYILKNFHVTGFDDNYLFHLIGMPLNTPKPKIILPSTDYEYRKIIKKFPEFNPNRVQINGTIVIATILLISAITMTIPDIHADLIVGLGELLINSGHPNRAFELCNAADNIIKSEKIDERCKLPFLVNVLDPNVQSLMSSFDTLTHEKLTVKLIEHGNSINFKYSGDVPTNVSVFFRLAYDLAEESEDPNFLQERRETLMKQSLNGLANVRVNTNPVLAKSDYNKSLNEFQTNNINAKIGKIYATQKIADSQKYNEPKASKINYNEALTDGIKIINELIIAKSGIDVSFQIDCNSPLDDSYLNNTVGPLELDDNDGESEAINDKLVNSLRVIASTCYGLRSIENDLVYSDIQNSITMKIFDWILDYRESDVMTLLSKSEILFDVMKYDSLDNLDVQIASYEDVLDVNPENKIALKRLALLYYLQQDVTKQQEKLDKLKNDSNKGSALIQGMSLFLESKQCDQAWEFYHQTKGSLNDPDILSRYTQMLDDSECSK